MTNFQFLTPEFKPLYEPAIGAERLVHSDPRAAVMRTRHALEQAVLWLYENDRTLRMPYDRSLNTLLNTSEIIQLLPPQVLPKTRLIQKFGNQAVHSNQFVGAGDALKLVRELFHVLFWLARTYTRASDPKSLEASFDEQRVPKLVRADEATALTRDQLQKQEAAFQQQLSAQHTALEAREKTLAAQAATLAEREALLAQLNAELATTRAELAAAKAASLKLDDRHDYHEEDTRKLFIDVLLREAGWQKGKNLSVEEPVVGMPNAQGAGFVDYVLWGDDGKPLAVVEAKRSLKDPEVGRQQAKLYADCLEQMKGQRPLIFYSNGNHTYLWDDQRAPPRAVQGFYTQSELALAIQRRSLQAGLKTLAINKSIVERSYQHRAIRAMSEAFSQGRRAGLLTMATGTGKTRMAIALVELLMRANWVKRVLFLADRLELCRQATNAFKAHLPASSPVNLVTEKNGQGRAYLSTYPTMMGLIEEMDGDRRKYGAGHFDLIIIDEAHRSVYQKYGAIFRYFDSLLVGLTATPRSEVHRDTYQLFGLEQGVPTDNYGLEEAVADGFLVPPKAYDVPLKFVRAGVQYKDLSAEEQEHWDEQDWDGDGLAEDGPESVHASEINKQLFNADTVDKMLKHLMQHGLTVEGGDRLGKTIIFAVNQTHAQFIAHRFNHHYPHHNGHFAQVITHAVSYAQSLIDNFSVASKLPQIAISVDMLDTGIDVPEVLNLVFFKAVRSKVKFLQMIGRGTRLCSNLHGEGLHKRAFYLFDYCGNCEYFNEHPKGADASLSEPLGKRLFKLRLDLLEGLASAAKTNGAPPSKAIHDLESQYPTGVCRALIDTLHGEVAAMNLNNFIVREAREQVVRYADRAAWRSMTALDFADLRARVAGLPSESPTEHITAKRFDLLCLKLQLALFNGTADYPRLMAEVIEFASALEAKDSIPAVRAELALIQEVQTDAYWQDISLEILETLRRKLRALAQFAEGKGLPPPVFVEVEDEMGTMNEVQIHDFSTGINLAQYKKKVEAYIRANESHVAIAKLKYNRPLTPTDLTELERFIYESEAVGGRAQFEQTFGREKPLALFIRSLVGLDRGAAKEAFGQFLDASRYSSQQIRFVEMIIDQLTRNGVVEPGQLYEPPYTGIHYGGLDGAFGDSDAEAIVQQLQSVMALAA